MRRTQEPPPPPPGVAFATIVSDLVKKVIFHIANLASLSDDKVVRPLIRDIVLGGDDGSGKFSFGVSFPGNVPRSRFAFLPVYISDAKYSVALFRVLGKPIIDAINITEREKLGIRIKSGSDMLYTKA